MARKLGNWLESFVDYASIGEAPKRVFFWVGVSTIAGALRRRVWLDMARFRWYPNFYVVLVAPPGVISKTTSANVGMHLLREVSGVHFGADVITAQALVTDLSAAREVFTHLSVEHEMSCVTFASGEFGNLLDPRDKVMVDLLVTLWDGIDGPFQKRTKHSGDDLVINPSVNLIACTTPAWIADNFPEYMIGGGFVSRCVFVYADKKEKEVAYPDELITDPAAFERARANLIGDLNHIAQLTGDFTIHESARAWGREWYHQLQVARPPHLDDDRFGGYVARKQSHIHKLAMILAAAESDDLLIVRDHLELANEMVTDLEAEMPQVFNRIGRNEQSMHSDRLLQFIAKRGTVSCDEALRYVHINFPGSRDFEDVLLQAIRAGYIELNRDTKTLKALPPLLQRFR